MSVAQAQGALRVALLGNPNCGKTALFNLMTGARQKVANYAGVTVERKEGLLQTAGGRRVRVLDLPGTYSLHAHSLDEAITRDIVSGRHAREAPPELLVCVTDATHLRLNLRLVLEARELGLPMVLVLNMSDMARQQGIEIDRELLAREWLELLVDAHEQALERGRACFACHVVIHCVARGGCARSQYRPVCKSGMSHSGGSPRMGEWTRDCGRLNRGESRREAQ